RMLEVEAINANEAIVTGVDNAKFNGVDTKQYALLIPEYIAGMKIVGVDIAQPSDLADVTSLFLPDTIRTIGAGSFSNMHVTEIVIPDGVQEIGNGAFAAKYAALHVYYDGDDIDANYFATSSYTAYLHTGATVAHPRNLVEKVAVTPASNFTYEVVRGREVVITGLTGAGRSESTVVLPTYLHGRKVTEIGDGAFAHNSNLTKLTLSKYVAEIGNNVFVGTFENVLNVEQQFLLFEDGNTHFTLSRSGDLLILRDAGATYTTIYAAFSVQKTTEGEDSVVFTFSVPEDVSEIREGAFAGVYSLRKIYGNAYFRAEADNTALVKIGAGEGVTSVLIAVLRTANDATFEIVSNDVYRVGAYAFYGSTLTTIAGIPQTVSELGEGAFENSAALVNVALPEGIAALPARVFYGCSSLVSVNIPNGVNSIGAFAFGKSGLNSIDFTALDLLPSIGDSAFADCGELRTVSFNGTNVTSIGKDAFRGCSKLISIDLFAVNDEATGERRSELTYIGEGAFAGTAITEIVLPENVTRISDYLFDGAKYLRSITALGSIESIGDYAFKDTEALTSIPDGMLQTLRVIGRGAFMGSGLREIALPQSVTEIAPETFKDCKYLTNVTLTSSLRKIGDSAFEGCDGRIDLDAYDYVEVSGGKVYLVNEDEPEDVVRDLINTTTVSGNVYSTIVNGRKIRAVGDKIVIDNRFSGTAYEDELTGNVFRVAYVDDLKVVLRYENGAYVLRIYLGDGGKMTDAKLNVSFGVTKINLGIRVTEIGARAFARTAIESVNLTDSVTKVGDEAFAYNDSLQSVLIGAKLESIGAGVFRGTPNLSGVDVNKKNTHFKSDDDKVLYMYDKVADGWVLKLYPAGRVPAGDLAFVVPADVVGIDEGAFDG
ncbi:MAG: leucine-rich repeat protein, partial [Clostridia bacterium]|nr:leucine-rich repeat protein [Clostridia bacterium]